MGVVASTWRTVLSVIGTHRQPATPADEIVQPTAQAVLPDTPAPSPEPA